MSGCYQDEEGLLKAASEFNGAVVVGVMGGGYTLKRKKPPQLLAWRIGSNATEAFRKGLRFDQIICCCMLMWWIQSEESKKMEVNQRYKSSRHLDGRFNPQNKCYVQADRVFRHQNLSHDLAAQTSAQSRLDKIDGFNSQDQIRFPIDTPLPISTGKTICDVCCTYTILSYSGTTPSSSSLLFHPKVHPASILHKAGNCCPKDNLISAIGSAV
jgi:hypothetical protein